MTSTSDTRGEDGAMWEALAGAQASLTLAETLLATGRPEDALAAARSGVEELGGRYRTEIGKDDTKLKLLAAEAQHAQGATDRAAEMTIRVLRERVAAFLRNHGSPEDS